MHAVLIHNPNAGHGRHSADGLIDLLRKEGISATYYSTKDDRYRHALRRTTDMVIAAGGDGTIAKVARELKGHDVPVAIIPLGTANNIACSLGLLEKPKKAVRRWAAASPRRFDVGLARGPWGRSLFLESTGTGAFADAVAAIDGNAAKDAEDRPRKKKLREGRRGFMKALKKAGPTSLRILADDERLPDDLLLVEIMNICCMGPRLRLAHAADCGDGRFDVVYLGREQRDEMLGWMETADADVPPPVSIARARKISIDWDGAPMRVGDKMVPDSGRLGKVRIELEPEGIHILVPADAEIDVPDPSVTPG
jgi:diacylglycerol kinase (ATP)